MGLDLTKFASCLASDEFTKEIETSISEAARLGVAATPSFIIGTLESSGNTVHIEKRIVGAVPYEMIKADLDGLLVSEAQLRSSEDSPMVNNLSRRALRALMEARSDAGKRGANSVDVNSLVIGLITEDQDSKSMELNERDPAVTTVLGMQPQSLAVGLPRSAWTKRTAFFPSELAASLLARLNELLPRTDSIPLTTELPTTAALDRVFGVAKQLSGEAEPGPVVPLDLLAAALQEPCEATALLQEAGITKNKVLQQIRADGHPPDNETQPPTNN
jgi:hypothetical protein